MLDSSSSSSLEMLLLHDDIHTLILLLRRLIHDDIHTPILLLRRLIHDDIHTLILLLRCLLHDDIHTLILLLRRLILGSYSIDLEGFHCRYFIIRRIEILMSMLHHRRLPSTNQCNLHQKERLRRKGGYRRIKRSTSFETFTQFWLSLLQKRLRKSLKVDSSTPSHKHHILFARCIHYLHASNPKSLFCLTSARATCMRVSFLASQLR